MNTKDFIKALRAVIREEVRAAVRQEVKAILTENTSRPKPQQQPKRYTGNNILDQVLNETRLTPEFRQSPNVDYQEFSFTSDQVQPTQPLASMLDMDISDDAGDYLPSANTSALPFMKDYTQLMKKADQISQGIR